MAKLNESLRSPQAFRFGSPFVRRNPVCERGAVRSNGIQRNRCKIIPGIEPGEYLLIYFCLTEPRDTRFSLAMNVIGFVRSDLQPQTKKFVSRNVQNK
jgi:hypothetical protein